MSVLIFCLISGVLGQYVSTPHGRRLKECVMSFPQSTLLEELPNGKLLAEYANGSSEVIIPPSQCHDDMARLIKEKEAKAKNSTLKGSGPNQWCDNAGWYPPSKDIKSFTGTYINPAGNPSRGGATLYYFIGSQNNGQGPVNILQPVLSYEGSGWGFTSWICCPSNISTTGPTVRTSAGATITGGLNRVDSSTWDVYSINENGQKSDLKQRVGPYKYTWADVTFEYYGYSSCSQSPKGPITFKDMVITNGAGEKVTPKWSGSGPTKCSGTLIIHSPSDITIEHSE